MLSRILRGALSLGHGGAFAFVPDATQAPIEMTWHVTPTDLGEKLIEMWSAHCWVWRECEKKTDVSALLSAAEAKRSAVSSWLSSLRRLAQLFAADGCVVLDKNLVLHGFGGKIRGIPEGTPQKLCKNLTTNQETNREELLKLYGTRHSSAFALCHEVPGAIVFVISQDGDLRLFASDETTVYFATGLHP